MAKKKAVSKTIDNFWFPDIKAISVDLTRHPHPDEESEEYLYNSALMFHLEVESGDDGGFKTTKAIIFQTNIVDEDMQLVLQETIEFAQTLFGCDFYSMVTVYDENGDEIEEFNLNDAIPDAEGPVDKDTYDLENMEAGVPVIKH